MSGTCLARFLEQSEGFPGGKTRRARIFRQKKHDKLYNLISEGRVRFNKSEISNEPCPMYFVESGDSNLLIENCNEQAFVEFK